MKHNREYNLGKSIKLQRLSIDMLQKELAKVLKTQTYTISDYECGRTEPDINMIRRMCVFFDISADELLGLNDIKVRKEIEEQLCIKELAG